jgi:hypothetical protein
MRRVEADIQNHRIHAINELQQKVEELARDRDACEARARLSPRAGR